LYYISSITDYLKAINDCKISTIIKEYNDFSKILESYILKLVNNNGNVLLDMAKQLLKNQLQLLKDEINVFNTLPKARNFNESVCLYNKLKDIQISRANIVNGNIVAVSMMD
jgi:hypothetical protein